MTITKACSSTARGAHPPPKIEKGAGGRPSPEAVKQKSSANSNPGTENPPVRETDLLTWLAGQALCLFKSESDYMAPDEVARRTFDIAEAMLAERAARIRRRSMI